MTRTKRDWRDTGEWIDRQADAEDRRVVAARYKRLAEAYGFSGIRAGFLERGWTDEHLCDLVRQAPSGRWEWTLFAAIARGAGLANPAPADLEALAKACEDERETPITPAPVWPRSAYAHRWAEAQADIKRTAAVRAAAALRATPSPQARAAVPR